MSRSLTIGPVPTGVAITSLALKAFSNADFGVIEEGPGILKFRDLTTSRVQPTTVRLQQKLRSNIYAGTTIESTNFLADKSGTDTIIEVLGVGVETDSVNLAYEASAPYRVALSFTTPNGAASLEHSHIVEMVSYLLSVLTAEGDADLADVGLSRILNGVLRRD